MLLVKLVKTLLRRASSIWKTRSPNKELINAIKKVNNASIRYKEFGLTDHYLITNVGLYVLLVELDFSLFKASALRSVSDWRQRFIARQLAIQLYEVSQDLPNLLGKDFRAAMTRIGASDDEVDQLNEISARLNIFKNENQVKLKTLRTYVGAHRDKDASLQLQIVEGIELTDMLSLSGDLYEAIRPLISLLTQLTYRTSQNISKLTAFINSINEN